MSERKDWLIFESSHQLWWRADACGYSSSLLDAGLYTQDDALRYASNPSRFDRAVPIAEKRAEIEMALNNAQRLLEALHD